MSMPISRVLEFGCPEPQETVDEMHRMLRYVLYCDGIGCNGSTKGAYKLSSLGFKVKELLGGLDWWRRDGHATASGLERSTLSEQKRRVSTP